MTKMGFSYLYQIYNIIMGHDNGMCEMKSYDELMNFFIKK